MRFSYKRFDQRDIPDSVTSIESYAFAWCYGLTSLTIGKSITNMVLCILYCTELTNVTSERRYEHGICICLCTGWPAWHPDSVTNMGDYAFEGCSGLTSVTIGNSVTSIRNYAFVACSSLTSVTIPTVLRALGVCVWRLHGLTSWHRKRVQAFELCIYNCTGLTSVTIPTALRASEMRLLLQWLDTVTIGSSVRALGVMCFMVAAVDKGIFLEMHLRWDTRYLLVVQVISPLLYCRKHRVYNSYVVWLSSIGVWATLIELPLLPHAKSRQSYFAVVNRLRNWQCRF